MLGIKYGKILKKKKIEKIYIYRYDWVDEMKNQRDPL